MRLALNKQSPKIPRMIVAGFLLLAILPPVALSASLNVQDPLKSDPTVRLTVLLVGKAQPGAKVNIYRYELGPGQEEKPRLSLITDSLGKVSPPRLTPGHYHIVASAPKNLTAELYLEVSAKDSENVSEFSLELGIGGITREELFTQAEHMPVKELVRSFHGIVRDPSGNPIPDVSIEIVRKGTQGRDRVARLKSGNGGQFSARLSAGSYIAQFSAPGFQSQFIPFEISEQGSGNLIVTLDVGRSTQ